MEKGRSYKNCDDWKREEKQHEATYICMLKGVQEGSAESSTCVLCGATNPQDSHFGIHNVQICASSNAKQFSCKRRRDMVQHLSKYHNVHGVSHCEVIANNWKKTLSKKAWSCGFCVKTFTAFHERLKHVQVHFEHGKTLADWDATTVVQGLLQQPGLDEAWKAKILSMPSLGLSDLAWTDGALKDLQPRLEEGPSDDVSARALADTAYEACEVKWWFGSD